MSLLMVETTSSSFHRPLPISPSIVSSDLSFRHHNYHHHLHVRLPRLACNPTAANLVSTTSSTTSDVTHSPTFVNFFHDVWPYIWAHRGSTIVVVISSAVIGSPWLDGLLQDLALIQGLGVRVVLVPETQLQIDGILEGKGRKRRYVGHYRITDQVALDAAMKAAGKVVAEIEAKLSPGPPTPMNVKRRRLGVSVATGNFLAAKRRGVVNGTDFGATGEVKKIDVARIQEVMDRDHIVVLSNLGYSSTGQVLNCNAHEVATACALAINADQFICVVNGQIVDESGRLIRLMSLEDAESLVGKKADQKGSTTEEDNRGDGHVFDCVFRNGVGFDHGNGFDASFAVRGAGHSRGTSNAYLPELAVAASACRGGLQRVHLVDGCLGGALLLDLFTRGGVGTVISCICTYEEMGGFATYHGKRGTCADLLP